MNLKRTIIFILLILFGIYSFGITKRFGNTKGITKDSSKNTSIFIKNEIIPINSKNSDDFSDLNFLTNEIRDKRVVLLGESYHGVDELNELKTRIIKFLNKNLDFEILAFESGFIECFLINSIKNNKTSAELMNESIFKVWHSKSTIKLFDYYKNSSNLVFTGFDYQTSSSNYKTLLLEKLEEIDKNFAKKVNEVEVDFCKYNDNIDLFKDNPLWIDSIISLKLSLIKRYKEIAEEFGKINIDRQTALSLNHIKIIQKFFDIRLQSLEIFTKEGYNFNKRDEIMGNNLVWIIRELYPDKKIIIWAHNNHIRYDNCCPDFINMMNYIPDNIKKTVYSIGFFVCKGKTKTNSDKIYNISLKNNSLEKYLYQTKIPIGYINLEKSNFWSENSLYVNSIKQTVELNKLFNSLIFIRSGTASKILN